MSRSLLNKACILSITAIATKYLLVLTGCGVEAGNPSTKKPKVPSVNIATVVGDPQLTSSIVNVSHGDAVAASADQSTSGSRLQFHLADSDNDGSTVSKSCSVSGSSAVVTVSSTINRSRTKTSGGGRVTVSSVRTGNGSSTRTWSMSDGTPVACNALGTGAAVNFQRPDNLKLDIAFERSRNDSITYTGPRVTRTASKSFTSSGSRSVTWMAGDSGAGSSTYIRNKSIEIKNVKQTLSMTDKTGTIATTYLEINTVDSSPLVVAVERDRTSDEVVSKTFASGQLITVKDSDAQIVTSYSNLKLNFNEGACSIISGSAQIVFKDNTGNELKTLILGVDSEGNHSLKDPSGEEVEGFALDPCDSEDLRL